MTELDLSIIVPAFNEASRIIPTLRSASEYVRARGTSAELIVVDDGSCDSTASVVRNLNGEFPEVGLIRLPENRGKGYAVRTGIVNARGRRILFMDADGSTPIQELERLEEALWTGADVAIGSRALDSIAVRVEARWYRRLVGRVFHLLVNTIAVSGFKDTQCGFKLFTATAAQDLFSRMRMDGFSFDVEVLLMARLREYRIAEVPVNWVHQPGSHVNLMADSLAMFRDLFLIRANLIRNEYVDPHVTPLRSSTNPAAHV